MVWGRIDAGRGIIFRGLDGFRRLYGFCRGQYGWFCRSLQPVAKDPGSYATRTGITAGRPGGDQYGRRTPGRTIPVAWAGEIRQNSLPISFPFGYTCIKRGFSAGGEGTADCPGRAERTGQVHAGGFAAAFLRAGRGTSVF